MTDDIQRFDSLSIMDGKVNNNQIFDPQPLNINQEIKKIELNPKERIRGIDIFEPIDQDDLSDEENSPCEVPVISGEYISKVLDARYNERFLLSNLKYELCGTELKDISFYIRGSKENAKDTVWTEWKEIHLSEDGKITSRIVFDGYRYFQFKVLLRGEDASVKIKNLDLEVI